MLASLHGELKLSCRIGSGFRKLGGKETEKRIHVE